MTQLDYAPTVPAAPKRALSLFDSTCIIVGIIIGSSIYESSPLIALCLPSPLALISVWALGGLLSLIGALCYAELATAYPADGGDYVYLKRAFGRPLSFLFAWAQLWIVRPGSIGAMAYVFARYFNELLPLTIISSPLALMIYAAASVLILTFINLLGLRSGKYTQNLLTTLKFLGLCAIVIAGLLAPPPAAVVAPSKPPFATLNLALILILYAYGGWNEMAYVAAEVHNPRKNILRSLLLGTLAVTAVYVLLNLAFVHALSYGGLTQSKAVAADALRQYPFASRAISILICISALGAINGMIFTGCRITYALGSDHRLYSFLGQWNESRGTPVVALLVQAVVTLALILAFGFKPGGFERMVIFTTPVFWIFFLLVSLSLFILRLRDPNHPRPYRVPLYPLIPALFALSCVFMLYSSFDYAWSNRSLEALWSLVILAVGLILSLFNSPSTIPEANRPLVAFPVESARPGMSGPRGPNA